MSCSTSMSRTFLVLKALLRSKIQMSIVKIVEAELKMEVRDDMRAAIITASISPRIPESDRQKV